MILKRKFFDLLPLNIDIAKGVVGELYFSLSLKKKGQSILRLNDIMVTVRSNSCDFDVRACLEKVKDIRLQMLESTFWKEKIFRDEAEKLELSTKFKNAYRLITQRLRLT